MAAQHQVLAKEEILAELKQIREQIAEYESVLASEKKLRGVIVKELEEIKKEYGDARRTMIQDEAAERSGLIRVIDDSGEDYLYPAENFIPLRLPSSVEQALAAIPLKVAS